MAVFLVSPSQMVSSDARDKRRNPFLSMMNLEAVRLVSFDFDSLGAHERRGLPKESRPIRKLLIFLGWPEIEVSY
jgi:hypothetical protein